MLVRFLAPLAIVFSLVSCTEEAHREGAQTGSGGSGTGTDGGGGSTSVTSSETVTPRGGTAGEANTGGVPTGLGSTCKGVCNAVEASYPVVSAESALGNVTEYTTSPSNGGACLYGKTNVSFFAAMSVNVEPGDGKSHWHEGRICGQCAKVTALTSQGPKQVVVRIMDKCPDVNCGIDLGGDAPKAVMLDGFGRYEGAWELISCVGHDEVFDGPTSLFVKDGSNAFWAAVQVRNPPMSVTAMNFQNQTNPSEHGSFEYASPQIENYYFVPTEVLQGNATFDITVTYRDGSTDSIALSSAQLADAESSYEF
jgi:expansin (peptidoglycan-binding protein)